MMYLAVFASAALGSLVGGFVGLYFGMTASVTMVKREFDSPKT